MPKDVMSMENFRDIEHKRLMQAAMFGYRYGHSNPKPYTMPSGGGKTLVAEETCHDLGLKSTVCIPRTVGANSFMRQSFAVAAAAASLERAFTVAARKIAEDVGAILSRERFQGELVMYMSTKSSEAAEDAYEKLRAALNEAYEKLRAALNEAGFNVLAGGMKGTGTALQAAFDTMQAKVQFPKEAFLKEHPKVKKGIPYYHGKRRF